MTSWLSMSGFLSESLVIAIPGVGSVQLTSRSSSLTGIVWSREYINKMHWRFKLRDDVRESCGRRDITWKSS